MPKAMKEKSGSKNRHAPLDRKGKPSKRDSDDEGDEYVAPQLSKRILEQARAQREEIEREGKAAAATAKAPGGAASFYSGLGGAGGAGDDSEESDQDNDEDMDDGGEDLVLESGEYIEAQGMTEAEERLVGAFMNAEGFQKRSLADMILDKIKEKEEREAAQGEEEGAGMDIDTDERPPLPPKVVEVYTMIGKMLSHYTAGKLPKAFKFIPNLSNWEEILMLTNPDGWSAHACYAATRIFASNLNPQMAQTFYRDFLLERCRSNIADHKRLNYHLYEALKKSVYKPAAFYKGIILPLAASGNCTLREATIFGSVLAKVSIPGPHSAVAILKLAEMPYTGATSLFIRVLLDKKYALPLKVISALVDHFMRFLHETRELPVLWHQCLLVFAQRYKDSISHADKERLKEILKAQPHHQISDEVRRELFGARPSTKVHREQT